MSEQVTDLMKLIQGREKKYVVVNTVDCLTGRFDAGKFKVRAATCLELNNAELRATEYIRKQQQEGEPLNENALSNAKIAYLLTEVSFLCVEEGQEEKRAFSSPQFMLAKFTAKELSAIYNAYVEAVQKDGPQVNFSEEQMDAIAELCIQNQFNDAPNAILTAYKQEALVELLIRFAVAWKTAKSTQVVNTDV